jgi:hypothetical protein
MSKLLKRIEELEKLVASLQNRIAASEKSTPPHLARVEKR